MSKKKKTKYIPKKQTPKKQNLRSEATNALREFPNKLLNYKQIASRIGVNDPESRRALLTVLDELVSLDIVQSPETGKYQIHPNQAALIEGTIDFTKGGTAYVSCPQFKSDVVISEKNTGLALQGDGVEISVIGSKRGQVEGKVVRVVSRAMDQYVGIIEISKDHAFFVPSNQKIHVDFYVDSKKLNGAKNGEKVIVKLLDWTDESKSPFAEIITVLGEPGNNEVEMHAILVEFGLPFEFPDAVLEAAGKVPVEISEEEIAKRRDFRAVTTFTIDPEDAKDFDDALSIRALEDGNYEVGVHIADVSHYVSPGGIIDAEAVKRATSVYLVDRVVPMLPEVLSNFVCSLRPHEDKLCMSAVFVLNPEGKVLKEWFGKTIINSNQRFVYEDAQKIIEGGKGPYEDEVRLLHKWATEMRKNRMANGALEFSGVEVKFKLDDKGKPVGVYQKVMKEANWLIEEFMLLANKKVAAFIGQKPKGQTAKTFVYRIHDLPDEEKLATLKDFVSRLGYKLKSTRPEQASVALNDLMHQLKDQPEEDIVKQMAIRTMSKAVYSTDNIGHYGLAFDFYTHFTSPIRRYPDLIVHRLLHSYQNQGRNADKNEVERQCKHSSNMEKRASDAERASIKYKQVEYMLGKIGEVFSGTVSGLTRWGMYVELEGNKCEGMVPLNSMQDDVYRYDERTNQIIGSKYKEVFDFGDKVRVKVHGADLMLKQLDFRMA
jgi:ribonuclease R